MILAKKNGWMTTGKIVSETEQGYTFKLANSEHTIHVLKVSNVVKLFDTAYKAEQWIMEDKGNEPT